MLRESWTSISRAFTPLVAHLSVEGFWPRAKSEMTWFQQAIRPSRKERTCTSCTRVSTFSSLRRMGLPIWCCMLGLFSLPLLSSPSAEKNWIDPSVRTGSIYRYRANANPTSLASFWGWLLICANRPSDESIEEELTGKRVGYRWKWVLSIP